MVPTARMSSSGTCRTGIPEGVSKRRLRTNAYSTVRTPRQKRAFRTCKTTHWEVRPVFVRTEAGTRGHVLVVKLAYLVVCA
ncbi:MAG: hypothetical protein HPY51_17085 [Candidatus Omnitrophica bacterium]|nr:hypothetical protein [Candidatus Omnitrophota bacterium]